MIVTNSAQNASRLVRRLTLASSLSTRRPASCRSRSRRSKSLKKRSSCSVRFVRLRRFARRYSCCSNEEVGKQLSFPSLRLNMRKPAKWRAFLYPDRGQALEMRRSAFSIDIRLQTFVPQPPDPEFPDAALWSDDRKQHTVHMVDFVLKTYCQNTISFDLVFLALKIGIADSNTRWT